MSIEISSVSYRLIDRYVLARRGAELRRAEKKICLAHPEWADLTGDELASIDRRERYGYMFYKNMAPDAGSLSRFIPDAPYTLDLLPRLNPANHRSNSFGMNTEFSDKNYAEMLMPDLTFPKPVLRRMNGTFYDPDQRPISRVDALERMSDHSELVFKQTIGGYHGHGIRLVSAADYESTLTAHGSDYVVQERVRQHEFFAHFNASSVNVLRVTSLFWRGDVYILGAILRVGAPGAFCDHENRNGETYLSIPISENGHVLPRACDVDFGHVYADCRGIPLEGTIPCFDRIKALVRQAHARWPHYGLIGWDVTVDDHGQVVFMEFNTKYPGLTGTQAALGPVLAQPSVRGVPLYDELMKK